MKRAPSVLLILAALLVCVGCKTEAPPDETAAEAAEPTRVNKVAPAGADAKQKQEAAAAFDAIEGALKGATDKGEDKDEEGARLLSVSNKKLGKELEEMAAKPGKDGKKHPAGVKEAKPE